MGIPSLTNIPAIQIVPVVPTFAPNIAAIADGKGNEPEATSPITAVVVSDGMPTGITKQVALVHTGVNTVMAVALLPFVQPIARFISKF